MDIAPACDDARRIRVRCDVGDYARAVASLSSVLDFVLRPVRSVLGAEHEASKPLEDTEREILDAVNAIHRVADSIEHEVEVIEGLATSVGPLTDSVNQLTATMVDLVALLAPMGEAEHGVERVEHFFGFHRHKQAAAEPEEGHVEP